MNWKVVLGCYVAAFVTFLIYFLPMLYVGQVFTEAGRVQRIKLIGHCLILLCLFGYATILASKIMVSKETTTQRRASPPQEVAREAPPPAPAEVKKEVAPPPSSPPPPRVPAEKTPQLDIWIYPQPHDQPSEYKYPLREYPITLRDLNACSSALVYCRIVFNFPYAITDFVAQPNSRTKDAYLDVQKVSAEGQLKNTSAVVFSCSKWPDGTEFGGKAIVDLTQTPVVKDKDKIGYYEGEYSYRSQGKIISKRISGVIPLVKLEEGESPAAKAPVISETKLPEVKKIIPEVKKTAPEIKKEIREENQPAPGIANEIQKMFEANIMKEEAKKKAEAAPEEALSPAPATPPETVSEADAKKDPKKDFQEKVLPKINPNEGTIAFSISGEKWLEKNNSIYEVIPHSVKENFEIRAYKDIDNTFKVLISNSFSKNVVLRCTNLDKIRQGPTHPKHHIAITWSNGVDYLYIDGDLVDIYSAGQYQ